MKKNIFLYLCLVLAILIIILMLAKSCSPDDSPINRLSLTPTTTTSLVPDKLVILSKIQSVSKLETVVFSFEQIIKGTKDNGVLWGSFKDEIVFVSFGQVIAGIDFSRFNKSDIIIVDEKNLKINLPQAEIFNIILDNEKSYIANRTTGFLTYPDSNLETQIRQEAIRQFEANAINSGILKVAAKNAQTDLINLLANFGFDHIEFSTNKTEALKLYPE